jgi:hypothetical protein
VAGQSAKICENVEGKTALMAKLKEIVFESKISLATISNETGNQAIIPLFNNCHRCKNSTQHNKVRSWANSLNYKRKYTNLFLIDFSACVCIIHDCLRISK